MWVYMSLTWAVSQHAAAAAAGAHSLPHTQPYLVPRESANESEGRVLDSVRMQGTDLKSKEIRVSPIFSARFR